MEHNHKLALAEGALSENQEEYRRLVGKPIFLTISRHELSYCMHNLAQFMQSPQEDHWETGLQVVCYLKGNPG